MRKIVRNLIMCFIFFFGQIAFAEVVTFDFKDPKKVNSITIIVDSALEPFSGFAAGITGSVSLDLGEKKGISGEIKVSSDKIRMANTMMTKVLHSPDWINVKTYPTVSFIFKELVSVKKKTDTYADVIVSGDFTLKGVTRKIEIPVQLTYLKDKLNSRNRKGQGDLLALRSKFTIDRTAFGIKPDYDNSIVAKNIEIIAAIIGCEKSE